MEDFASIRDILSSSADVVIIGFGYFLWKLDRRMLSVELQLKTLWRQATIEYQKGNREDGSV